VGNSERPSASPMGLGAEITDHRVFPCFQQIGGREEGGDGLEMVNEDEAYWEVGGEVLGGRFSVTYYPLQGV